MQKEGEQSEYSNTASCFYADCVDQAGTASSIIDTGQALKFQRD